MMKLFKIAFLSLLAGMLLPVAALPVRAAGAAVAEAKAKEPKRGKKKKHEADTVRKTKAISKGIFIFI